MGKTMSDQEEYPELPTFLTRFHDRLVSRWAELVHQLPGSHYAERSLPEIQDWLAHDLGALAEACAAHP